MASKIEEYPTGKADTDTLGSAMNDAERRQRKREYTRHFMQAYRGKEKKAKEELEKLVARLEARIALKQKRSNEKSPLDLLSWRDVASAFYDLRQASTSQQRTLRWQIQDLDETIREMKAWVLAVSSPVHRGPRENWDTWRDYSLLAHPTSRRLGKQWITQQMYYNVDRVFDHYGVPATHVPYDSRVIEFGDHGHRYVQSACWTWAASLETVVALYTNQTGSMFTHDGFCQLNSQTRTEVAGNTKLHEYAPVDGNGLSVELLCGEFQDPDRCILVIQQILSDDLAAGKRRQRRRMAWIELRRSSESVTYERNVGIVSEEVKEDGSVVPLEEAAWRWGLNLSGVNDESTREALFVQAYRARNDKLSGRRRQWYADLIAQVAKIRVGDAGGES